MYLLEQAMADWKNWNISLPEKPQVERELLGGHTNRSFLAVSGLNKIVIRVNNQNNENLGIDRQREIKILALIESLNISPKIYFSNNNVLISDFIEGYQWKNKDFSIPSNKEKVSSVIDKIKNIKEAVQRVIEKVGLVKEAHKKIGQLSKGYKQRVGIAQAIVHDPKVLILDEPTSGLDPNQLEDIRGLIKELGKNKTVILSTHIMQEVDSICDRIVIIKNGSIVADRNLKQNSKTLNNIKEQIVSVEFENKISITQLKKGLPKIKIEKKETKFLFYYNGKEDLRKLISSFAQKNEILILEIKQHSDKLEDLFKKLTK